MSAGRQQLCCLGHESPNATDVRDGPSQGAQIQKCTRHQKCCDEADPQLYITPRVRRGLQTRDKRHPMRIHQYNRREVLVVAIELVKEKAVAGGRVSRQPNAPRGEGDVGMVGGPL